MNSYRFYSTHNFFRHLLSCALLTLVPGIAIADTLTLVKDRSAQATIVVEEKADEKLMQAALDLQFYIREISGAELPLKKDGIAAPGTNLHIGRTRGAQTDDAPGKDAGLEAFAVRLRDGDLYFRGKQNFPTAFAVYAFIEKHLGVRWFAPGDDWTYIPPKGSRPTLQVEIDDSITDPDFSPRVWSSHDFNADWNLWNLRNKTLQSEVVSKRNFQNNIYRVFPASKYAKTHPEYYPLINGKRQVPADDKPSRMFPCFGNPEVQQVTVEYIRGYFDRYPTQDSFSLGIDDVGSFCQCSLCRAMDTRPDDYEKRNFSNRYYSFVNIIAREVKKTHPDKFIGTLIYNVVQHLPENVPQMEDNVFGFMTQRSALWFKPEIKAHEQKMTLEWARRMKLLSRYDYFGMSTLAPRFYPHLMDEAIKLDKSLGFKGMYGEIYTFLPQTAPMIWSLAQLQWDADHNIDTLLDEFYEKMFGNAAPSVKRYFALMEESWMVNRPGRNGWVWRNLKHQALSISPEAAIEGEKLLSQALLQTQDPLERKRIDIILAGLQYGAFVVKEYDLAAKIAEAPLKNERDAFAMKEQVIRFGQLISEREKFWRAAEQRDDLLGANIEGLKGSWQRSFFTNASPLELPVIRDIIRLTDWFSRHHPEHEKNQQEILGAYPKSEVRLAVESWLYVQSHNPPSLLSNGDFENLGANSAKPEGVDWITAGAPRGWNFWSRYGAGGLKYVPGRESDNAIQIASSKTASAVSGSLANLLRNVPGNAGETFFVIAWVKLNSIEDAEKVSLRIRTRQGSSGHGDIGLGSQVTAAQTTQWQPLIASVTIPERATFMTLVLNVGEATVIFDDVALYKIQ